MGERDGYHRIEDEQGEHVLKISEISYVGPLARAGEKAFFHIVVGTHYWGIRDTSMISMMETRLGLIAAMLKPEG